MLDRIKTYRDFVGELNVNYKRTTIPSVKINDSLSVVEFIRPYFEDFIDNHEEVKVIHLNRANKIVNIDHVSKGSDTSSLVPIKDIVRNALLIKTHGIILVHNHPSGNCQPSKADINISNKLKSCIELFEIRMLDSIILTRESFYSLLDEMDLK